MTVDCELLKRLSEAPGVPSREERIRAGIPTIPLSIPLRYVHTVNEMASEVDVDAAITVLARYLEEAHTFDYTHAL